MTVSISVTTETPAADGLPQPQRALAIVAVLAAMSLAVLDAGMANVALPTISRDLNSHPATAVLVVTSYQTALVMALLPLAAVGEWLGYRRVFRGGVAVFAAASLLCAASNSLPWLIAGRFLQGLGGAAIMALGVALLRSTVAKDRLGAAIGWNALTVALSSAASPAIGAFILSGWGWRGQFIVDIPIAAIALLATAALPSVVRNGPRPDSKSILLNAAAFAFLVLAMELLLSRPIIAGLLLASSALALAALIQREIPKAAPLFPLDLLRGRAFRLSVIASVCCFAGQSAALVALPFYLQHGLGQSPLVAGLYLTPWPLGVAATAMIAGRLADRYSMAWLCAVGGAVLATGMAALVLYPVSEQPIWIAAFATLCGVGFGLFQVPNNRNMFLSAPIERSGAAGGMQGTARLTGQTMGAVLMTILFAASSVGDAPCVAVGISAILALTAGIISLQRISK